MLRLIYEVSYQFGIVDDTSSKIILRCSNVGLLIIAGGYALIRKAKKQSEIDDMVVEKEEMEVMETTEEAITQVVTEDDDGDWFAIGITFIVLFVFALFAAILCAYIAYANKTGVNDKYDYSQAKTADVENTPKRGRVTFDNEEE